jgi:NTP pyrophosphatase (non-canonical NTP hydrolase)
MVTYEEEEEGGREMNEEQYRAEVLRTYGGPDDPLYKLSLGAMGLAGETGEVVDHIKKVLFAGHILDAEALMEEMGDVLWYLALLSDMLGCSLALLMEMNVKKLQVRYPDGFDPRRSQERQPVDPIADEYCWQHTPGGRGCEQCRELQEIGEW